MGPEDWSRVKEILGDALERPRAERESFVDQRCARGSVIRAEVDRLLALDVDGDPFLEPLPAGALAPGLEEMPHDDLTGRRIGGYRVVRRIAAGGMGAVFEAEQEHPRRTVALKLIRPGVATASILRRFDHETEMLGRLEHPGIARIYEAGTFDLGDGARPFFAMELVDGVALTDYARRESCNVHRRVELMAMVCDAVHHAHQKGVIHRDLKPANILVDTTGMPRVLDFGVARAVDADVQMTNVAQTGAGELVGTLRYMSPEQVEGDSAALDTRSDVYALGVVCYELLAGRLPYDLEVETIGAVCRTITEREPVPLGATDRVFRGDLETIVGKALEKDRERRYESAAELGEDLRRWRRNEPISARAPTAVYQLRKFARRNRILVGGVTATLLVLVVGVIMYGMEARRTVREAENTRYEAEKYRAVHDFIVNDFLWKLLATLGSAESGQNDRIAKLVDVAAADVDTLFEREPLHAAAVRNQLATMYYNLGRYQQADVHFTACLQTRRQLLGLDHRDTLNATNNVGLVRMRLGRIDDAEEHWRVALAGRERLLGSEHADTLVSMNNLAALLRSSGDLAEAERLLRRAMEIQRRVRGAEHADTLTSMSNLAAVLDARDDAVAAEAMHREAVDGMRASLGERHVTTLVATTNLARTILQRGRAEEAETLLRAATEGLRGILGDEHLHTLAAARGLADALVAQEAYEEAEVYARLAVDGFRSAFGPDHERTRGAIEKLIRLYDAWGRDEDSARWRAELKSMGG